MSQFTKLKHFFPGFRNELLINLSGMIDLPLITKIIQARFALALQLTTQTRVYTLRAKSVEILDAWTQRLTEACALQSPLDREAYLQERESHEKRSTAQSSRRGAFEHSIEGLDGPSNELSLLYPLAGQQESGGFMSHAGCNGENNSLSRSIGYTRTMFGIEEVSEVQPLWLSGGESNMTFSFNEHSSNSGPNRYRPGVHCAHYILNSNLFQLQYTDIFSIFSSGFCR